MRAEIKIICANFIFSAFSLTISAQSEKLPEDLKTILDKIYSSWKFDEEFNKRHKNLESFSFPVVTG